MDIALEAIGEASQPTTTTILGLTLSSINQRLRARIAINSAEDTTQVHILDSVLQEIRNPDIRSQGELAQHLAVIRHIIALEGNRPCHGLETQIPGFDGGPLCGEDVAEVLQDGADREHAAEGEGVASGDESDVVYRCVSDQQIATHDVQDERADVEGDHGGIG